MTQENQNYSLVADVGGTNTRVALAQGLHVDRDTIKRYPNESYESLETILALYMTEMDLKTVEAACIAIAGPVSNGHAKMTNLNWSIDEAVISKTCGTQRAALINDLQAHGYALGHSADEDYRTVHKSQNDPQGAKLVINIGTGFNIAPVYETAAGRYVAISEAGHSRMFDLTAVKPELAAYIDEQKGFASIEEVLSGRGLATLYKFLTRFENLPELKPAEIFENALKEPESKENEAFSLFCTIMAKAAGNYALMFLPAGGIYLVGGVAQKINSHLHLFDFSKHFSDKGRSSHMIKDISVYAVNDDYAALTGSAAYING